MKLRHSITKEYQANPRHKRRWALTIEWLKQFDTLGDWGCLDCGDRTHFTRMIEHFVESSVDTTSHNFDEEKGESFHPQVAWGDIFAFEIIEHLLNPLIFMNWISCHLAKGGSVYLSTPINRPKWMRNKEKHFHEFNYNELEYLIEKSGFKIVNEKRINCTTWKMITGFRPLLRFFGIDKNILLKLKRK